MCACEAIAKEQQEIVIRTEKRRYGKMVTIVEGLGGGIDMAELARSLKTRCASGGTVKDGRIELQGDHQEKVESVLEEMGFMVKKR